MFKKITATAVTAAMLLIIACGNQDPDLPDPVGQGPNAVIPAPTLTAQQQQQQANNTTSAVVVAPTLASPIAGILDPVPTATPEPVNPSAETNDPPDQESGNNQVSSTGNGANGPIAGPIAGFPQMPTMLNEVQLVDVYDAIGMEQFAVTRQQVEDWQLIRNPLTAEQQENHPYRPMIAHPVEIHPGPGVTLLDHQVLGPRAFLDRPWQTYTNPRAEKPMAPYSGAKQNHLFYGKNSLRETLANAVGNTLQDNALPGVEPVPFHPERMDSPYSPMANIPNITTISQYIRHVYTELPNEFPAELRGLNFFNQPSVGYDFIHPQLPIMLVTVENKSVLPLAGPDTETTELFANNSEHFLDVAIPKEETTYRVVFVISFQTRWKSFDDPNRWLLRFRDIPALNEQTAYETGQASPNAYSTRDTSMSRLPKDWMQPEKDLQYETTHGHRFWHYTDYMHHRLIGPVWVQVVDSTVLEEGIFAATPAISHWEAPGPIVPDEHLLADTYKQTAQEYTYTIDGQEYELITDFYEPMGFLHLRMGMTENSPNPGLPLPGHVLTHIPHQTDEGLEKYGLVISAGPGTQTWKEHCRYEYFASAFECPSGD